MKLVIKNGTVIDGTGEKKKLGDILVEDGVIKDIAPAGTLKAEEEIDANGMIVTPGFVDILNHSDAYWTLFNVPTFDSLITQGVTTVLVGNCGSSLAPLVEGESILSIQKWADISEVNVNWLKLSEFLDELSRRDLGVNFATLVGHATLRRGLLRDEFRELTSDEIESMKYLLEEAMDEGAFGLSLGLAYSHAKIATQAEIEELARVVKNRGDGLVSIHLRDESDKFLIALNEALNVSRSTGVSLELSHFKVVGKENWSQLESAISMIEGVVQDGYNVNFDTYPYLTIGSVLYIYLPDWVAEGGKKMLLKRLREPSIKQKVVSEMKEAKHDFNNIRIAIAPTDKTFIGKSIQELAENQGVDPEEALINMLIASSGRIIAFIPGRGEENLKQTLKNKYSFIASDGSGYKLITGADQGLLVHPRCFGAFPRVLNKYTGPKKLLSWEEAIYKMSGGPAAKIGLTNRGILKKGYAADIVVINPDTIKDRSTFKNPYQYSEGIEYVLVNGERVVSRGKPTGKTPGQVLRKG